MPASTPSERWDRSKALWNVLTYYQRFETAVAFVVTGVTALMFGAVNPLQHEVFQAIFGEIMTLLIALEFNHTLRYAVTRHQSIIQTKVVVLIALLALARKFIILDIRETTPGILLGLAATTLALGATYWLIRERDDRGAPAAGNFS